ncbi:RCL1 protein, partial [Amia calva]|nr:RCL1 protein [Amia calva]
MAFLTDHNILEVFQSGFKTLHSTESALFKVFNNIFLATDSGDCVILVLLDLTAAFDTVDHEILISRLDGNQIRAVVKSSFFQLRQLAKIKETVIHAFVTNRLDYCNALYVGVSGSSVARLQMVQNAAACLLTGARKHKHISPILASLHPGLLYGGAVEHDCNLQRSIGYYLEPLLALAPFMKSPIRAVLRGVTNDQKDPSVDTLKATAIPLMKKFGLDGEGLELKVVKRGMPPGGGGEVLFTCPVRRCIKPVQLSDPGKIKRIRGIAYSVRVSPQIANRMIDSARSILNLFIPDIYIYTDHMKGVHSGKSPGFGLSLVAETINGTFLSAELASNPQGQGDPVQPEDLGKNCAKLLLEEIYRGGCVDSINQSLVLLYMTLGPYKHYLFLFFVILFSIEFLRHIRDFFQVIFKIETQNQEEDRKGGEKVLMTCVGAGYTNISKTVK